jgi:beta-ureidopropionase
MAKRKNRLPREVWVASMSLKGLWPEKTMENRMKRVLERMENLYPFEPDIICLPETIQMSWVDEKVSLGDVAEDENSPGPVTSMLAEVAKKQNCYITCPVITKKDGHFYNSSILINRQGKIDGVYNKIHPTTEEIIPDYYYQGGGLTPGADKTSCFKTDFGTVGLQVCMDAFWQHNWDSLRQDGAEMILFSSQGSFEESLSHYAWLTHSYIAAATGDDSFIIDMTGDFIARDGEFARWVCAPVNLEKAFLHIWPQTLKFP